jgi:hypothetical protein
MLNPLESTNKNVINRSLEVFEDQLLSTLWLNTPNHMFENNTPLYFCQKGSVGYLRVLTFLERMQD